MKIGEMTLEQLGRFVAEASEPAAAIMKDQKFVDGLKEYFRTNSTSTPKILLASRAIEMFIPKLFGDHLNEIIKIVAALEMTTPDKIRKRNGLQVVKAVKDSFDKELIDFFTSSEPQTGDK